MPEDRYIEVKDQSGEVLYKGPDKRYYNSDYKIRCALGVPIVDWIKYATIVGSAIAVIYNGSTIFNRIINGIDELKAGQRTTSTKLDYLGEWTQNNDRFQTAYFGTEFKDGKPQNDRWLYWNKNKGKK